MEYFAKIIKKRKTQISKFTCIIGWLKCIDLLDDTYVPNARFASSIDKSYFVETLLDPENAQHNLLVCVLIF